MFLGLAPRRGQGRLLAAEAKGGETAAWQGSGRTRRGVGLAISERGNHRNEPACMKRSHSAWMEPLGSAATRDAFSSGNSGPTFIMKRVRCSRGRTPRIVGNSSRQFPLTPARFVPRDFSSKALRRRKSRRSRVTRPYQRCSLNVASIAAEPRPGFRGPDFQIQPLLFPPPAF
jgi:hypothetical protein